ncbi:MAG: VWA domain-containing protein [Deltaproteobacteria bacterium]|nr:VWA domain-containing protein [Deltaproteobacteria bacterium]
MLARYTSSKALVISLLLHVIFIFILFVWPKSQKTIVGGEVDIEFLNLETPKPKRRTPPKRPQVRAVRSSEVKMERAVSNVQMANVTLTNSNAIYTDARIREGDSDVFSATPGIGAGAHTMSSMNPEQMRVYSRPIEMKRVTTRSGKRESRLIQFINSMDGPQDIIYCIDLSSSMNALGAKQFQIMINLIQDSLRALEPHDRFNILTFGARTSFQESHIMPMTENNVQRSTDYLKEIHPDNTPRHRETDIFTAIEQAKRRRPTIIVLFSDGLPTSGATGLKNILDGLHSGSSKLFTMTINMDENYPGAVLLKKMSDVSAGEFWLVAE